eukprot:scaffold14663_cov20-Tisochrysis_lutea.AAC.1
MRRYDFDEAEPDLQAAAQASPCLRSYSSLPKRKDRETLRILPTSIQEDAARCLKELYVSCIREMECTFKTCTSWVRTYLLRCAQT